MEKQTVETKAPNLYKHEVDAVLFLMMKESAPIPDDVSGLMDTRGVSMGKPVSILSKQTSPRLNGRQFAFQLYKHKACMWMLFNIIHKTDGNVADKKLIWLLKSKFNMSSDVVVCGLKALETIFDCVNSFSYANSKNVKRYNTDNKDLTAIKDWCNSFEYENPDLVSVKGQLTL